MSVRNKIITERGTGTAPRTTCNNFIAALLFAVFERSVTLPPSRLLAAAAAPPCVHPHCTTHWGKCALVVRSA
jgi:hypothetical protein